VLRIILLAVLTSLLLQACSLGGLPLVGGLFAPTGTRIPSATATITRTPTRTATFTQTLTASPTATIVRLPTFDPNAPTATLIPVPIYIGKETATPAVRSAPTITNLGAGFLSVTVSANKIFWGSCKRNKVTVTAVVEDPGDVFSVVIFVRVKSAKKEDFTPWTTGDAMHDHRNGTFTYVLRGTEIEGHNHYRDSWVWFQLVAVDFEGVEVGRTPIYNEVIAMSPCM
jgi:hypothetical protein